jgi:hypothetical protein
MADKQNKTAEQVFTELAEYIKTVDNITHSVPVGIVISSSGLRFIVKYSNHNNINVYPTYQEAVNCIARWLGHRNS